MARKKLKIFGDFWYSALVNTEEDGSPSRDFGLGIDMKNAGRSAAAYFDLRGGMPDFHDPKEFRQMMDPVIEGLFGVTNNELRDPIQTELKDYGEKELRIMAAKKARETVLQSTRQT
ncbi:MAG: hypothetical protein ABH950_01905 [Candidatus Altiarchaeota archaeon]